MADLLQSSATTATTTPQYYTDYMTNLAQKGTAGGNAAQYVGATPLQQQAFGAVAQNVGNYQPALAAAGANYGAAENTNIIGRSDPYFQAGTQTSGLTQANPYLATGLAASGANVANPYLAAGTATSGTATANPLISQGAGINALSSANPYLSAGTATSGASVANPYLTSGTGSAADLVGNYMNPYTQSVVDQIRLANQQNIAQNLSPSITSGAVGSGQFGSQRGANALALGISNTNIGALSEQAKALQSGYANSLAAAQQQRANQLTAGQTAGTLQNQFAQNQVNAGQIAGNLQNQTAQNQITAGQNLGALQNQANANQVNAGQVAGNLLNTYGQNALTAGQTAGTLQNQFNTNQITAGQAAANAAAQQAAAQTAAATGQLNLGQQIQQSGLTDVNALSTLGQQQQQIAQNQQLFPLDVAAKQAAILSGAQIPTTVQQTMEGSPLSAIAGLGGLTAGMFTSQPRYDPVTGRVIGTTSPIENIISGVGSAIGSRGTGATGSGGSGILGGLSSIFGGLGGSSNNPSGGGVSSGGFRPGEGYNPGSGASGSGPSMDTSSGVKYNADGTITDSAGNIYDQGGNYIGADVAPDTSDAGSTGMTGLPSGYTPPDYSNTVVSDNGNSDLLANADVNMGFDPSDPNYWYA